MNTILTGVSSPISHSIDTKPLSSNTQASFSDILKSSINHLNQIEQESDFKTEALINGEIDDLHDVMIAAQKASITVETTVQIQKKVIDAYNEIMRMQI